MYLGEVCIMTRDVQRLAAFYKALLQVDNGSDDCIHQTILAQEPMLTILHDELPVNACQTMCMALTVVDIDAAYAHAQAIGAEIAAPPSRRPWGTVNMLLRDPDGNLVYLRQQGKKQDT